MCATRTGHLDRHDESVDHAAAEHREAKHRRNVQATQRQRAYTPRNAGSSSSHNMIMMAWFSNVCISFLLKRLPLHIYQAVRTHFGST